MLTVEIGAVRLHRVGVEDDPGARAVVEVEVGGRWVEVLSEPLGSNFCSGTNAGAIAARAGIVAKTSERLALDVSLEVARALHRVWRALNDGDCPKCHQHVAATEIGRGELALPNGTLRRGIFCPNPVCKFYVLDDEIERIEKLFAPAMDGAVAVFETWRNGGG